MGSLVSSPLTHFSKFTCRAPSSAHFNGTENSRVPWMCWHAVEPWPNETDRAQQKKIAQFVWIVESALDEFEHRVNDIRTSQTRHLLRRAEEINVFPFVPLLRPIENIDEANMLLWMVRDHVEPHNIRNISRSSTNFEPCERGKQLY